ncbi:DNA internalization-related competence protein ComEC/Rec2 [Facklamia miroungae]|uniref:DNA internalization-related competence protein ComEC/Rec2 n=1 Tax=Facklamia miroungae TaxID=120956 RepID=A0A1G7U4Y0_9LACT|nr:DNA internalization-related competence protein ComEC/Rec2 [Facklamia miroungae]NKZ29918.1 DNA internalization-related competence protein ComEC/Rec2 [Facklamia miroungae]SDG42636.1 DNA internalization-related competence protein ComEC/Rec2 [Facklamia miroungae]
MINVFQNSQYHWTLIAIVVSFFMLFIIQPIFPLIILFALGVYRIWVCRNRELMALVIGILLLVFLNYRSLENQWQSQILMFEEGEQIKSELVINPNHIQQNEDIFYGEGGLFSENEEIIPVIVNYWNKKDIQQDLPDLTASSYVLAIKGKIKRIEANRNFDLFDYQSYLKRKGIAWELEIDQIEGVKVSQSNQSNFFLIQLINLRARLTHYFRRCAQIPLVSIHNKLLYNLNSTTYRDYKPAFMTLGILHFFSISGFHVNYIRNVLTYILLRIGISPSKSKVIVFTVLILFAWLVDWPIGALRSLLVNGFNFLRRRFHWPFSPLDCLSIVYILLLVINPYFIHSLAYILSFLMSYLIYFYQGTNKTHFPIHWQQKMEVTLFCFLFSWPLLLSSSFEINFLQVGIVLIFTPLFEAWIMPAMFGFSTLLLLSQLAPKLLQLIQWLSNIFELVWETFSIHKWVKSGVLVLGSGGFMLLVFLFVLGIVWFYFLKSKPNRAWKLLLLGYLLVIVIYPYLDLRDRIIILDVGQGDALLYKKAFSKKAWLIDTGGKVVNSQNTVQIDPEYAYKNLIPALKAQGITCLEGVIITHPDIDHLGNLSALEQEMPIKHLYYSVITQKSEIWRKINHKFSKNIHHHVIQPGKNIKIKEGDIELLSLNMPEPYNEDKSNASSLISILTIQNRKMVNMADLPLELEEAFLKTFDNRKIDFLKIGHHGSKTSTSDRLLDQLKPELTFISSGKNNRYQHPHPETLYKLKKRGITYLDTQEVGAIEIAHHPLYGWQVKTALKANE